jgi:hypothetical protein
MNFAIELQAATTEGYSILIGIIYFLLLIVKQGTTESGNDTTPITFSIIESAISVFNPPVLK